MPPSALDRLMHLLDMVRAEAEKPEPDVRVIAGAVAEVGELWQTAPDNARREWHQDVPRVMRDVWLAAAPILAAAVLREPRAANDLDQE